MRLAIVLHLKYMSVMYQQNHLIYIWWLSCWLLAVRFIKVKLKFKLLHVLKKKNYQHKYLESHHQGYLHACVSNNEIICCFISLAGAKDAISKSWSLLMWNRNVVVRRRVYLLICNNMASAAIEGEDRRRVAFWKKWKLSVEEKQYFDKKEFFVES